MIVQRSRNPRRIGFRIMIAQNGKSSHRSLQALQNTSAGLGGFGKPSYVALDHHRHGYEIPGQHNQVGIQAVDDLDRFPNRRY